MSLSQFVVESALKQACKTAKDHFEEADLCDKTKLRAAAEIVAKEQIEKEHDFHHLIHGDTSDKSDEDLSRHISEKLSYLPKEHVGKIKEGLKIPSVVVSIKDKTESRDSYARITKPKDSSIDNDLDTTKNVESVIATQFASVLVEGVGLVLCTVGINVTQDQMTKAATEAAEEIEDVPEVQKAIEGLKQVFQSEGSIIAKAKAVWELLKAVWHSRHTKHGNFFVYAIKLLLSNVSTADVVIAVVKIAALVASAVAVGGSVLIAKAVAALESATEFGLKIYNLIKLDEIKENVKSTTK